MALKRVVVPHSVKLIQILHNLIMLELFWIQDHGHLSDDVGDGVGHVLHLLEHALQAADGLWSLSFR